MAMQTALARPRPRFAWLLTLAIGTVVVTVGRIGPDWPAQEFRTAVGLQAWSNAWYAGHALLGYSVLFPLVAAVVGVGVTGLAAATVTTWASLRLMPMSLAGHRRTRVLVEVAVALAVVGDLVSGQVPFLLGLAFGAPAFLAVRARHSWLALALAICSSLASPLAGFFVLLVGLVLLPDVGWRRALPLAGAGAGSLVAVVFGGSSGSFPFDAPFWGPLLGFVLGGLFVVPRELRPLRRFIWLMALVSLALFVVPNPIGGNIDRLSQLYSVPLSILVVAAATRARTRVLGRTRLTVAWIGAVASLVWIAFPVSAAVDHEAGDPSSRPAFFSGLNGFLATRSVATLGRVEIPFTRGHWEAAYVAPHYPIARGWERQTDIQDNAVLYHPLTAASYRAWLDQQAIGLVAVPAAPTDRGGAAERALLQNPPSYLSVVYRDADWTVYRVADPTPIVSGATLEAFGTSSVTLRFDQPGTATVRVHSSPLWSASGAACVVDDDGPWLEVRSDQPGTVTAAATAAGVLPSKDDACP